MNTHTHAGERALKTAEQTLANSTVCR